MIILNIFKYVSKKPQNYVTIQKTEFCKNGEKIETKKSNSERKPRN